ncbi:MAG TPA: ABC-2 family transporter protein [Phycisphaerae bacterium]|nr:ABC-2 family transporter protein [Phycisphaerae bacterium]
MARIIRILTRFWTASLSSEMEYRANFITSTLYALGQLAGTLFTINVLYDKGYQFAGWSLDETYIVVALFTLMDGITTSVLSPNLSRIVQHVQRGTLDFILLKPVDSQFQLSTRNLTPWGFPNIAFATVLLIYAGAHLSHPLPWHAYLMGILPVLFAVAILYALWFAVATTTIWFTKVWNATEVLRSFIEAGKFPASAFPPALSFFLTFILPVAFLTTVPAEIMRGDRGPRSVALEAAIAAVLLIASRLFWKFALRYYTSASS